MHGDLNQRFSNCIPQRVVRGSERRKCITAVLSLYLQIKLRVATFDTNHSVTDSTISVAASIQKLSGSVVKSLSRARHRQESIFQAKRPGCRASLRLAVDFLHVIYIKDKHIYLILYLTDCGQAWVPQ